MVEGTTMDDMTQPHVTTMGEAMAPWLAKLRERGLDPANLPPAADDGRTETPQEAEARRAQRAETYAARWRERVPAMYQDAKVTDLDASQHVHQVRSWLASGALHLVLAGPVGTGKTHAAYAVGNQAAEAGKWVEAWAVGDLMDAMRPGSSDHGAEHRARSCHILILDDLMGKATDWEAERLTMLLDARVRDQLRTVVTTNITSAQITETWGSRLMDRLRYRLTPLTFHGESRRGAEW